MAAAALWSERWRKFDASWSSPFHVQVHLWKSGVYGPCNDLPIRRKGVSSIPRRHSPGPDSPTPGSDPRNWGESGAVWVLPGERRPETAFGRAREGWTLGPLTVEPRAGLTGPSAVKQATDG